MNEQYPMLTWDGRTYNLYDVTYHLIRRRMENADPMAAKLCHREYWMEVLTLQYMRREPFPLELRATWGDPLEPRRQGEL